MINVRFRYLNISLLHRPYSKHVKSARTARKEFLDYFTKNAGHKFIRSSPVVPFNDPTTPFVNAGMNQFKGILLGLYKPPAPKVVNFQKCIRVGGKHNDLDVVGSDTYHHTFFEMLGNWSFGDYFKKEACEYAWKLLIGPYNINKDYLYITYFGGDEKLGLEADLECKDIWLQLGVSEDRILPFGVKDNFWEMAVTGPCGPCTEIHIDHAKQAANQAARVNKGHADLTELWNIVFIQHQRLSDGSISSLSNHHIDTGMGFERLLAVIQGKRSNYDTDLFQPLFKAIEKFAKVPKYEGRFGTADKDGIDTGYRILADHARMVTVALSDGALPDQNPKLRRVLRRSINVSEKIFQKNGLLNELTYRVVESLGETYPELEKNINKIRSIIQYEEEVLKTVRDKSTENWNTLVKMRPVLSAISDITIPGLVPAYKELQNRLKSEDKFDIIPGEFAYKLYDTYGLNVDTIAELAKIESLVFDIEAFKHEFEKVKERSRLKNRKSNNEIISEQSLNILERNKVPITDDSLKYNYTCDGDDYYFSSETCKLLGLISNGNLIFDSESFIIDEKQSIIEATVAHSGNIIETDSIVDINSEIGILLDKTRCYAPEGGQMSDKGYIKIKNLLFNINEVRKIRDYVFHIGNFINLDIKNPEPEIQVGDECVVSIDPKHRLSAMRHHTAMHLLNAALKQVLPVVGQRASAVEKCSLTFECSVFGNKLNTELVIKIENLINDCIQADVPVNTKTIDMLQMLIADDITTIPGEIYPDNNIRIVEINSDNLKSKEACCGTHIHKTGVLQHFCILNLKSQGSVSCTIKAVAGPLAKLAKLAGENIRNKILELEKDFEKGKTNGSVLNRHLHEIKNQLTDKNNGTSVPYVTLQECLKRINNLSKAIQSREKEIVRNSIEDEMKNILHSSSLPFVVHYLQPNSNSLDSLSLSKITKLCPITPVFVIACSKGWVKARCCVPKNLISDEFNARSWMGTASKIFNAQTTILKNEDPLQVCNMKLKKITSDNFKSLIDRSIVEATKFASLYMKKLNNTDK